MGHSRFARDYEEMTKQQIKKHHQESDTYVDDMIKSLAAAEEHAGHEKTETDQRAGILGNSGLHRKDYREEAETDQRAGNSVETETNRRTKETKDDPSAAEQKNSIHNDTQDAAESGKKSEEKRTSQKQEKRKVKSKIKKLDRLVDDNDVPENQKPEEKEPYVQIGSYLTDEAKKVLNHEVRRSQSNRRLYMEKLIEEAFREMDQGLEPDEDEMEAYISRFKGKKQLVPFDLKKRYFEKFSSCAAWHIMNKSEFCNYLILRNAETK